MSALQIILLNLHSQWGIYIVCRGLDTAVLFVTECLRRLQIYVWEHPMLVIFYFVKACRTDCQTCRIKDKSMHALLMTCIAKQEQDGGQLDVIYAGLLPHGEKKQVSYRSVPHSVDCIMVCCHGLQSNDCLLENTTTQLVLFNTKDVQVHFRIGKTMFAEQRNRNHCSQNKFNLFMHEMIFYWCVFIKWVGVVSYLWGSETSKGLALLYACRCWVRDRVDSETPEGTIRKMDSYTWSWILKSIIRKCDCNCVASVTWVLICFCWS